MHGDESFWRPAVSKGFEGVPAVQCCAANSPALMAISRKFVALLVAVVVLGVPSMACLVPSEQLTSEERECCKHMSDMCGRGSMPSSHSCCQTTVRPTDDATLTAARSIFPIVLAAIAVNAYSEPAPTENDAAAFIAPSPPESPPATNTVLRI
jgi:hypothetical protein